MRLILFGDSFIDPLNHPSIDSWMHIVASGMGMSSHIPGLTLYQQQLFRNIPIGDYVDFGDIRSYALQGSSIEYSQAQLMHYLKHDYDEQDVIIYGITDEARLPFINPEFNKNHGFGNAVYTGDNYDYWLYYTTIQEKRLKSSMIAYILNTLPNKKVLIDCFETTRYGYRWHIQGSLYEISNYELGGTYAKRVLHAEFEDTRSNHLGPENHVLLGQRLIKFLNGNHRVTLHIDDRLPETTWHRL